MTYTGFGTQDNLYTTGAAMSSGGFITATSRSNLYTQPMLQLKNNLLSATGVFMEAYKEKPSAGVAGDEIFRLSMTGKNSSNSKEEYGRITCNIRDPSGPSAGADGQLLFAVPVGDAMTTFMDLNGNSNNIKIFKNLVFSDNTIQTTAFTGSIVPVVTTSPLGYYPAWTFVNNTEWNFQITSSLAVGYYTVTWQGQLQNLANAIFPGLSTGLRVGSVGSVSPTKFPNIQLLKLSNTGTSENFIYFGGSVSFYNSIAQQISVYVEVSNGYVQGTTASVAALFSTTTIKLS
jgi:hypothetical protein